MRLPTLAAAVASVLALAAPALSRADEDDRPRPAAPEREYRPAPRERREGQQARPAPERGERGERRHDDRYRSSERAPAPAYSGGYRPGYAPGPAYAPPYRPYRTWAPWWAGSGWGWGYRPLVPVYGHGYGPSEGAYAPDPRDRDRVNAVLQLTGAGSNDGAGGGVSVRVEGPIVGFQVSMNGVAPQRVDGFDLPGQSGAIGYGNAHVTWSLVSDEAFRLRAEVGGAMLTFPLGGDYAGLPYAGTTTFGPSVGVSGTLGLVGPIGFEGHARMTPYPVPVVDSGLGLVLRAGPAALTAGWRSLDFSGDGVKGPSAHVSGPELGLAFSF